MGRWGVGGRGVCEGLRSIDVGVCYTRGAKSRRWCGWWDEGAMRAGGGGIAAAAWMAP